ncbi:MAG: carboxypeptidase-like regulatory domain-containing protein [Acidobacteriota bacterium]
MEEDKWSCDVPAGLLDAEFRVAGYVPMYEFGVEVKPASVVHFAPFDLKEGGSLVGRAESIDGELLTSEGSARLFPFVPRGADTGLAQRLAKPVLEVPLQGDGFFQLAGLASGAYVLEVAHPGFVEAREFPLEVWDSAEVRLKAPITLYRPLEIEVLVEPPEDWRGKPWQVSVSRMSDLSGSADGDSAFRGALAQGRTVLENQAPGTFLVKVQDSLGNQMFGRPDVMVTAADPRIAVTLDLVIVRGELLYGEEPVEGTIWFGGRSGISRAHTPTDRDGAFIGVLPEDGWWDIEVDVPELELEGLRDRVEVRADSKGEADLDIVLPETEVFGRVVDEQGRPVAEAQVFLRGSDARASGRSEEDGEFRLRAFREGAVSVAARKGAGDDERSSDSVMASVVEGTPWGPAELVLHSKQAIRGRVVSEKGSPVPGASVDLEVVQPFLAASGDSARTDLSGYFDARLRADAQQLHAIVSAPGHGLQARSVPFSEDLTFEVSAEWGRLFIRFEGEVDSSSSRERGQVVILQDGIPLSQQRLWQWSRGHGVTWQLGSKSLEIPRMAPGLYTACVMTEADYLAAATTRRDWRQEQPTCVSDTLPAGGEVELVVPERETSPSEQGS